MCTVSMIGDHYAQKWNQPNQQPFSPDVQIPVPVSRDEFNRLRDDVSEMKSLLLRAKEYDKKNNQPDCEQASKIAILRKVAEAVGVDLDDVFGPKT